MWRRYQLRRRQALFLKELLVFVCELANFLCNLGMSLEITLGNMEDTGAVVVDGLTRVREDGGRLDEDSRDCRQLGVIVFWDDDMEGRYWRHNSHRS